MEEIEYEVYKGLQKPLSFMGLQGRYILWAALGALCSLIIFAICFFIFGLGVALIALLMVLGSYVGIIAVKQKRGLHSKKIKKGIHISNNIFRV